MKFPAGELHGRAILPIGAIARLEEFPLRAIERAGAREVLQYRGRILPVLRVSDLLEERRRKRRKPDFVDTAEQRSRVQVAVIGDGGVGLVVDRILDIVDLVPEVQTPGSRKGVKGTMIVEGRVAGARRGAAPRDGGGRVKRLCTFRLGGMILALPSDDVREVIAA